MAGFDVRCDGDGCGVPVAAEDETFHDDGEIEVLLCPRCAAKRPLAAGGVVDAPPLLVVEGECFL